MESETLANLKDQFMQMKMILRCGICRSTLKQPMMTTCNHAFCSECLSECFKQLSTFHCPICNSNINKRSCEFCPTLEASVRCYLQLAKEFKKELCTLNAINDDITESQIPWTQTAPPSCEWSTVNLIQLQQKVSEPERRGVRTRSPSPLPLKKSRYDSSVQMVASREELEVAESSHKPEIVSVPTGMSQKDLMPDYQKPENLQAVANDQKAQLVTVTHTAKSAEQMDECDECDEVGCTEDTPEQKTYIDAYTSSDQVICKDAEVQTDDVRKIATSLSGNGSRPGVDVSTQTEKNRKLNSFSQWEHLTQALLRDETYQSKVVIRLVEWLNISIHKILPPEVQKTEKRDERPNPEKPKPVLEKATGGNKGRVDKCSVRSERVHQLEVGKAGTGVLVRGNCESNGLHVSKEDRISVAERKSRASNREFLRTLASSTINNIETEGSNYSYLLVYGQLDSDHKELLKSFLEEFKDFRLSMSLVRLCTHLVLFDADNRSCEKWSVKHVYALANRCSVVAPSWLRACLAAKRIVATDDHVVIIGPSRVISRTDQIRNPDLSSLFTEYSFYVPFIFFLSGSVPRDIFIEISRMCGARLVDRDWNLSGHTKRFIIFAPGCRRYDVARRYEVHLKAVVVTADWVFKSIVLHRVVDWHAYRLINRKLQESKSSISKERNSLEPQKRGIVHHLGDRQGPAAS